MATSNNFCKADDGSLAFVNGVRVMVRVRVRELTKPLGHSVLLTVPLTFGVGACCASHSALRLAPKGRWYGEEKLGTGILARGWDLSLWKEGSWNGE